MKEEVGEYLTLSTKGRVRRNVLRPHVLPLLRKFTLDMMMVMRMKRIWTLTVRRRVRMMNMVPFPLKR